MFPLNERLTNWCASPTGSQTNSRGVQQGLGGPGSLPEETASRGAESGERPGAAGRDPLGFGLERGHAAEGWGERRRRVLCMCSKGGGNPRLLRVSERLTLGNGAKQFLCKILPVLPKP